MLMVPSVVVLAQENGDKSPMNAPRPFARNITLNEAVQLGVDNNKMLKLSNAKIAEAKANVKIAEDHRLPDLKASGSFMKLNTPDVSLKVKLGSGSGSSGGGISVDRIGYGMINASVPVFGGFAIKYGIESAKFLEKAVELDALTDKEGVINNTVAAYGNIYKLLKAMDLLKANANRQMQRVRDFENLEKNGMLAHNDLLKAQLAQSNIELNLMEVENNYKLACVNMALMLGLPEETQFIPDSASFNDNEYSGTLVSWEQVAMQNRPDYFSLENKEKAMNASLKATKGEYYPGLAVTGGYIAADIPNFITITNAVNVGVGLQYNIGSLWKTGAKVNAAKARLNQVQISQSMLTDKIHIEVTQAYENYLLAKKKTEVYAKEIEQATENFRITKNKFNNNLVTTTELLDADVAQLQATINYNMSKADAILAFKKLEEVAGTLSKEFENKK